MKRNRFLAFLADTRGASAVEFALVAGPFILILLGSVEFGRYVWTRQAVQDTAIAGARCVGVLQRPCEQDGAFNSTKARNFVIATAAGRGITLDAGGINIDPDAICAGLDGFSRVEIAFAFESPLPEFSRLVGADTAMNIVACFPNQD